MLNKIVSNYLSLVILAGGILLLLEFFFFNSGVIFSLLVAAGMIYIGKKRRTKKIGKFLFWAGIIFLVLSIVSMITFKFLLFAILIYYVIQFVQSKKNAAKIQPIIKEPEINEQKEPYIRKCSLFHNAYFGKQQTPEHVYEWSDVNIQAGVGDTVIDLSYTVLPKGETVIFIRNYIGNVRVLIPYDLEVDVHHSVIAGSTTIFDIHESKLFNQAIQVQTPGFETAEQKVKIFTSLIVGNLEVKRI
ncbi:cell wall-active antibiotics response protein LiaF [Bacillus sp. 03113]|uniref:cell wall-active antibiotics response protein LiaF n=1 Tax=Bacillus sp. 03113 TaxID=2578211 RepID=UPI00114143F5|nr:cell wall-active antibiotics response protein LiaF [Bacillus sp. 03113]